MRRVAINNVKEYLSELFFMKDLCPRDAIASASRVKQSVPGMADRNARQVAGFFLENARMMSKKLAEVKRKEGHNERAGRREKGRRES